MPGTIGNLPNDDDVDQVGIIFLLHFNPNKQYTFALHSQQALHYTSKRVNDPSVPGVSIASGCMYLSLYFSCRLAMYPQQELNQGFGTDEHNTITLF